MFLQYVLVNPVAQLINMKYGRDDELGHELDNRALIFGRKITLTVTANDTQITF